MDRKNIRNLSIFTIVSLLCGWFGVFVDKNLPNQPEGDSLGMGIWLVFPLLTVILLRLFAGDGWKDIGLKPNFQGNVKWYTISLLAFPIVTGIVLFIGSLFGWISFSFRIDDYFSVFAGFLLVNFVKNIFEEFVWRGYLTTKLLKLKLKDIWLYLIVGLIWGLWHLPYYLVFLPESEITQFLPVEKTTFALIAIIIMVCWSVMFVELYRLTKSVWVVVLLHMMEDSIINHLISDTHIVISSGKEIIISPVFGIITSVFYIVLGLSLRKKRIAKESICI